MNLQPTLSTFTVPLSENALRIAEKFKRYHSQPQKARQVYRQTLAVYAVNYYLHLRGLETDLAASHSWNPILQALMDVADLEVRNHGKIECRTVCPGADFVYIPGEVWCDRTACVTVELSESPTEATLLGFIDRTETENVPLNQLRSLEELTQHLLQKTPVKLSHWLDHIFEAGWYAIDSILAPASPEMAFAFRTPSLVKRGKILNLQRQGEEVALVVGLKSEADWERDISVEVYPTSGYTYLPDDLQLILLDEKGKSVMQAEAGTSEGLEFQFTGEPGELFSVRLILGDLSITEQFLI